MFIRYLILFNLNKIDLYILIGLEPIIICFEDKLRTNPHKMINLLNKKNLWSYLQSNTL